MTVCVLLAEIASELVGPKETALCLLTAVFLI